MSNLEIIASTSRGSSTIMNQDFEDVQKSYDQVASEYVKRISGELERKPLDRQLLDRFAAAVRVLDSFATLAVVQGM
jgi:hypothetical protein